ncbi:MAG TPA: PAS domain-containing protein [Alphaproteobacteria bacterium]|nr:PAS domain-containing protein [Alphaproteobacteria bacterium]
MRLSRILVCAVAGLLPAGAALAATADAAWGGEAIRLVLSMALVFASAGIGFWLAHLRKAGGVGALDAAVEALPQPRQIVDGSGRVIFANAACRRLLGDDPPPLQRALAHQLSVKELEALRGLAQRAGAGESGEIELEAALGPSMEGPKPLLIGASSIPGQPGAVLWRVEDISRPRDSEEATSSERGRQAEMVADAPVGFYTLDEEGRLQTLNRTFAGWVAGADAPGPIGKRLAELLGDSPAAAALDPKADGGVGHAEGTVKRADGASVELLLVQERVEIGGIVTYRGAAYDLGPQRELERRLTLSGQRFRHFFDKAPIGVALLDRDGRVSENNRAFAAILAAGDAEIQGRSVVDLVKPDSREAVANGLKNLGDGDRPTAPIEVRIDGKEETVASLYLARLEDAHGSGAGLICHVIDLTEQKRLEAQFAQSQKMQAVGQLAGGIAHDFNNLLTAMIGFCDLLLLRHRPGDQSFADIMQIKQNANRAANLVRQLLAFSRQQTLQPRVLNVADALTELSHLLRRLIGENIELKMIHGRELGLVRVDQGQLEQVIINLAVNARDAMPQGGALTIRTGNFTASAPMRRGAETMPAGDYVRIEVGDTGTGIPAEIIDRIFEPFFSTKEVGAGTGLGLSTVYGIVRQTGGFVFVDSRAGQGAVFNIYLPVHGEGRAPEAAAPELREAEAAARDLTGIGTILLVEDEDAVRLFGARALRNKGYEVLEARSGEEALELMAGEERAIDLLITDVVMPRMDGPALIRAVRERWPRMKVIYISGYAEDAFRKRLDETGAIHFLPKPFSLKQLAGKVKEVMETSGRPEAGGRPGVRRGGAPQSVTVRS